MTSRDTRDHLGEMSDVEVPTDLTSQVSGAARHVRTPVHPRTRGRVPGQAV
jgi:hypothetical protein